VRGGVVVGRALEVVAIGEAAALERSGSSPFSAGERAYAHSKTDPERRLAARLAAKRAAVRALGGGLPLAAVEVRPARGGPPALRLSDEAEARLHGLGANTVLVSLTHGVRHAAASVLLLRTG
jgi:phosphopantetheinyl transferase (holo-ACP synthase)